MEFPGMARNRETPPAKQRRSLAGRFATGMATFIDEYGDIGTISGASKFFRLAAVWFERGDSVDEYLAGFRTLIPAIQVREDFEFHFSAINDR